MLGSDGVFSVWCFDVRRVGRVMRWETGKVRIPSLVIKYPVSLAFIIVTDARSFRSENLPSGRRGCQLL